MTAPQIPNLLDTLRASKTPSNTRPPPKRRQAHDPDKIVQGTDTDAAGSRLSATTLGYIDDEFAAALAPPGGNTRRMPIINRGTYVRTTAIDMLVRQFLARHADGDVVQIVSLGAGTDSRLFRLLRGEPGLAARLKYCEVDFAATTRGKILAVEGSAVLFDVLKGALGEGCRLEIAEDKTALRSAVYSVVPLDLRSLVRGSAIQTADLDISPGAPTLVISECCLTYFPPDQSMSILETFTSQIIPAPTSLEIIQYEPLHPGDAFGRTMLQNLAARRISVPGLEGVPTLQAHKQRLREAGFTGPQDGWEIKHIWEQWISEAEKDRLRGLEMVDEEEEWNLLAGHYGIVRAMRTADEGDTTPVE